MVGELLVGHRAVALLRGRSALSREDLGLANRLRARDNDLALPKNGALVVNKGDDLAVGKRAHERLMDAADGRPQLLVLRVSELLLQRCGAEGAPIPVEPRQESLELCGVWSTPSSCHRSPCLPDGPFLCTPWTGRTTLTQFADYSANHVVYIGSRSAEICAAEPG